MKPSEDRPQVGAGARKPLRICLCAFPWATEAGHLHPLTVSRILNGITEHVSVIARMPEGPSGDATTKICSLKPARYVGSSKRPPWLEVVPWTVGYLRCQFEMSYHLARLAGQVDTVLFYEGPHYLLPALVARLTGKKVMKYMSSTLAASASGKSKLLDRIASVVFGISDRIVLALSHRVIVPTKESQAGIGSMALRRKTSEAMYSSVDDRFCEMQEWHGRDDVIGYVGRLVEVKGVLQLARAIPLILEKRPARFLVIGDGVLMPQMIRYLAGAGCLERVSFVGWVPEDMIPYYMNKMKFHILPSYHDFPGMVNLEAMACGTVAIANRVGGVADVVLDAETGFLMEGNEPETIANKVIEVWEHPRLEAVRRQGMAFAREHYTTPKVIAAWISVFSDDGADT